MRPVRVPSVGLALAVAVLACALFGALLVPSAGGRPGDGRQAELKVGVVDLASVFKDYEKLKELEKRINAEQDKLRKGLDDQRTLIKDLQKRMDLLDYDSPQYQLLEEEKKIELARFEFMKERLSRTIKSRWEEYNLELLEDIEDVVQEYGEKHGFTLILKSEDQPLDGYRAEKLIRAGFKSVLYFPKHIDITPEIVSIINRRYRVGEGSKTGKPQGGQ